MSYPHFILMKRGPLNHIWLAAHGDKKLTKAHVLKADIGQSVKDILSHQLSLTLSTSSHLLLGIVHMYSRKAEYLLADCSKAFVRSKRAFQPSMIDLATSKPEGSLTTIDIPEDATSFDLDVVDFKKIDFHTRFAASQSRPEDITMCEEVACMPFVWDDVFGDNDKLGGTMTIEDVELTLKEFSTRNAPQPTEIIDLLPQMADQEHTLLRTPRKMTRYASLADSGFDSPTAWMSLVCSSSFNRRSIASMFQDLDCAGSNCPSTMPITAPTLVDMTNPTFTDARMLLKTATKAGSYGILMQRSDEEIVQNQEGQFLYKEPAAVDPSHDKTSVSANVVEVSDAFYDAPHTECFIPPKSKAVIQDLTTLLENDPEAFALGPVEVNTKERKTKRIRCLITDEHKVISSETMKGQLSDSSDLVMSLSLSPPTKKLMLRKETDRVDKLFILPGRPIVNVKLFKQFSRNLVTTSVSNDNLEISAAAEELRPEDESRIEMMQATTGEASTDAEQEFSQSLFSSDVVDKNLLREWPASPCHDCSVSLPISKNMSNINDDPTALHENNLCPEMNISPCLDWLSIPASDDTDNDPAARQKGSPRQKLHKQSLLSKEPSLKSVESVPQPNSSSDFEEDLDNEDAIFDFELAPTCSEKANLRQEFEEAELEENPWNWHFTQVKHILQQELETSFITSFRKLTTQNNRKQAALKFYSILALAKAGAIGVEQQEAFGDILISRGPAFDGII